VGWVHPWVGLGWIGSDWVGLGCVHICQFSIGWVGLGFVLDMTDFIDLVNRYSCHHANDTNLFVIER